VVEFNPSNGLNPLALSNPKYKQERLYVTWHPGPQGHRYYAQIIAHFYLNSLLNVLTTITPAIETMKANVPTLEMYDLLQDIPADSNLPPGKYCGKVCTSSKARWCISGMVPSDTSHNLRHYNASETLWPWKLIASNSQSLLNKDGGQAAIDAKYGYLGDANTQSLDITIKTKGKRYVMIHRPYADWNRLQESIEKMRSWLHLQLDGEDVECIQQDSSAAEGLWMVDNKFIIGCVIALPEGDADKRVLSIAIGSEISSSIPVWAITTF